MACPVCLRYSAHAEPSLKDKLNVLTRLAEVGFLGVTISGGEPFLDPDLHSAILHAKAIGLYVALTTNGLLLDETFNVALQASDELALPLDGSAPSIHAAVRGSESHFHKVTTLLAASQGLPFPLVVNTVITAQNKDDLENILELLLQSGVRRWRLHRYYPVGMGAVNRDRFLVSDEDFIDVVQRLEKRIAISPSPMRALVRDNSSLVMKSYVNISPTGDILLFGDDLQYHAIGNILKTADLAALLERNGFRFDIHDARGFAGQYSNGLHAVADLPAPGLLESSSRKRCGIETALAAFGCVELVGERQCDLLVG